jgi:hypothetical protein
MTNMPNAGQGRTTYNGAEDEDKQNFTLLVDEYFEL